MNKGGGILIVFGLFWSGITLMFDGFTLVPAARQVLAQRFATTQGTVLSSEVTNHDSDEGTTHGVRIMYSYTVVGREYTGDRFRYDKSSSSDSAWARQAVKEHPVGSTTTVYYDPRAPENAVLRPGLAGSDLFMAMFMTPFNAVMVGFWWFGWSRLRRRWHKPGAGGVKVWTDLRHTRVRLNRVSPLVAVLATVSLLAFVSVFVVAFGFGGFHPSFRVMQIAWAVILICGLGAGCWHWQDLRAGKYDLILDELNGTLQLPRTCGRKAVQTLPTATVQHVAVETVEKRDRDGDPTYTYIPTLQLNPPPGQTEKLIEWHDAEQARDFATWLNEKLGRTQSPAAPPTPIVNGKHGLPPKKN